MKDVACVVALGRCRFRQIEGIFEVNVPAHLVLKLNLTLIDEVLESPEFLTRAVAGKVPTSQNLCVQGGEVDIQRRVHT